MVFKLVRTDTEEPRKIQLPIGTHIIGRGKFLDCTDKRVSRNHGELQVSDDSITMKALHTNPCFFVRKGSDTTEVLRINNTTHLSNGDKFGLLPDSNWYEILLCSSLDTMSPELKTVEANEDQLSVLTETQFLQDLDENMFRAGSPLNEPPTNGSPSVLGNGSTNQQLTVGSPSLTPVPNLNQEAPESPSLTPRPESPKVTGSPSLLDGVTSDLQAQPPEDQTKPEREQPQAATDQTKSEEEALKRSHSPDSPDVKRVKTEPPDDALAAGDGNGAVTVKVEPDAVPGPSNDQGNASSTDNGPPPSPVKPNAPAQNVRERCMYGDRCYRKNPAHKAMYSHPSDADWSVQRHCPQGASCLRRDPRHWRDNEHGTGVQRPPTPPQQQQQAQKKQRAQPRKRTKRQSESNSDSDDIPSSDLIVTGKRSRKPLRRDSWNDSESDKEEDPYATDESEDWVPDTQEESQYSQTQAFD